MRKFLMLVLVVALSAAALRAEEIRATLELDSTWLSANDDLVATVTISNPSAQTLLVPRWLVPGPRLDADLFEVTRDGVPVAYLGRLVKRAPATAGDFVELAPGASLRGVTELTKHYEMADGGEYVVAFRSDRLERLEGLATGADPADRGGAIADPVVSSASNASNVSNAVAVWREGPTSGPHFSAAAAPAGDGSLATPNCSSSESSAVGTAVTNALNYASGARSYLDGRTASTVGSRFTTWFGAQNGGRFNTVSGHYTAIRSAFQSAPITVDCGCDESYYAYVFPTQPYTIYVCNAFWPAPATGTDSKAGTLIHEMSHFNVVAGTDDNAYGQNACRNLASGQPALAVQNADSHEYFAENSPPLESGSGGAGTIRFTQSSKSVAESIGSVTLTAERAGGSTGPVSIHYATANGTATTPGDYAGESGTLSWGSGDSSNKSFDVPVVHDAASEADETFIATLSSPTGGAALSSPSSTTVTITGSTCTPSFCVPDDHTLCLAGGSGTPGRFRVRVDWTDFEGASGPGVALAYTADSGFFYFFNSQILELLVKVVNGCTLNDAYWFFYGSTSNVALRYTVEDLQVCASRTVNVPLGQFASNGDVEFFNQSCP
ncbi:MAG: M35 family metallo-endopeptidase [Thermoanaerobaculia bacterium]